MEYVFHPGTGTLISPEECVLVDAKLLASLLYGIRQSELTMSTVDAAVEDLASGDPEVCGLIVNEPSDFPNLKKLIGDQK